MSKKKETKEVELTTESKPKAKKTQTKKVTKKATPKPVKKVNVDLFEVWYGANEPMQHHVDLCKKLLNECGANIRVDAFRRNHGLSTTYSTKELCKIIWNEYK